mmetsp:Transcript_6338/g.11015  ORF Transcript_6338/g.11015 Transcript_6338/m.11015 type:complete len:277 (+) Transcript_6338:4116-4946(+)
MGWRQVGICEAVDARVVLVELAEVVQHEPVCIPRPYAPLSLYEVHVTVKLLASVIEVGSYVVCSDLPPCAVRQEIPDCIETKHRDEPHLFEVLPQGVLLEFNVLPGVLFILDRVFSQLLLVVLQVVAVKQGHHVGLSVLPLNVVDLEVVEREVFTLCHRVQVVNGHGEVPVEVLPRHRVEQHKHHSQRPWSHSQLLPYLFCDVLCSHSCGLVKSVDDDSMFPAPCAPPKSELSYSQVHRLSVLLPIGRKVYIPKSFLIWQRPYNVLSNEALLAVQD